MNRDKLVALLRRAGWKLLYLGEVFLLAVTFVVGLGLFLSAN